MSTSSTIRRFGAAKTYGRTRSSQNNAPSSFDDITGKPVPLKASPAHTKWGKTNFVAIREEKKSVFDPSPEPEKKEDDESSEDPFSFDTDDKRRPNPNKPQRIVVAPEVQSQRGSTRLPASRIVTQGKRGQGGSAVTYTSPPDSEAAVSRSGRTYGRTQEAPVSSGSASQLILDQFVEVGKTVKTDSGIEVVYSIEPHEPHTTDEVPTTVGSTVASVPEMVSPKKPRVEPTPFRQKEDLSASSKSNTLDDDDDDIFPATFRRTPLKTYTGEIITPISDVPDDPPPRKTKRKGPTGLPRGRKPSRYTDPNLIEEYRKRYEETHGKREPTAGMFNSTVVSSKELRGSQGTTLVVVCKPKVEVSEKKDDVQTKYFKNVKKELEKAGKNLEVAEGVPQESAPPAATSSGSEAEPAPASTTPSPCLKKPSSSQDSSSSSVSTPTRILKVRFADEESSSPVSTKSSKTSPSPEKPVQRVAVTRSRDKPASQESTSSENSTANSNSESSIASRTRSGGKQYRIFKSRGPPQPMSKEPAVPEEDAAKASSPPMPELTREVTESSGIEESTKKGQNPPNITGEATETIEAQVTSDESEMISSQVTSSEVVSSEVSQAEIIPAGNAAVTDSQVSQQSGEALSERTEEPMDESSSSEVKSPDSQGTATPDDSQELIQEIPSSAESQKEDSVTAAPRRFFKSKKSSASTLQRKVFEKSPSKALYNARSWQQEEAGDKEGETGPPSAKQAKRSIAFSGDGEPPAKSSKEPHLIRSVHWPKDKDQQAYTSVKVQKQHKELYTVVHNVKMAYEVQESGETQDFMDDVEYLLDYLKDNQPLSIRALSTLQLAGKCISPAFRMHLRAHGTVTKIFSLLHDSCSYPSLALSTAAMMFMLSRDRLNMDLDKESLHLMLKLNEIDMPRNGEGDADTNTEQESGANDESSDLEKCRKRVQDLLVQLQTETNAKEINLDFVSTGNLAMESLLSLTSRRAGEWFKEELRTLGGLDHFVETIHHCGSAMKEELAPNLDRYTPGLKKLDRCLRVLENITFTNSDNQAYIIDYKKGLLISATRRIMQQCVECLPTMPLQEVENEVALKDQAGWIVFECLLAILRVMLNITHDSEPGSKRVGEEEALLQTVLECISSTQWCVPPDQRFDLLVLSLGLLINLMEYCSVNRQQLVESSLTAQIKENDEPVEMNAVEALVQLFLQRETAAREMEEAPESPSKSNDSMNKSGEWRESDSGIEWIAKSAEKVKAAEKEQKEAAKEGGKEDKEEENKGDGENGEKPIDGASILEDEETFTKALHKAGKHMENSIVASYVGLLLGCLIQDNKEYVETVRKHLPDGSFESMIKILKKFLGFMNLTTAVGTTDANSIQRVIDTLEAC